MQTPKNDGDAKSQLTALVKGGGPSGLAAAVGLAQQGFRTLLAEKRPFRPVGAGRKNMVAVRPEALHQLDLLGGLEDARSKGTLTAITQGLTYNEWEDSSFVWPLDTQPRYDKADSWSAPPKLDMNVPSSYINLGHLEDHLTQAAQKLGVEIYYSSTFELQQAHDGSERYIAEWKPTASDGENGSDSEPEKYPAAVPYDIIVCASGKNDASLANSLGFRQHVGVKLEDENLPAPGSRLLKLGPEHEIETQRYLVFGVRSTEPAGTIGHDVRKHGTGEPEQPIVEISMRHAAASHYILQVPRGFQETEQALDTYATQRVNARQGTAFTNVAQMRREGAIVWGDPLTPVKIETSTAPTYVFGSNVVLVGDAGCSCSPTSGLGADVGMTHDGQAIRQLAHELREARLMWEAKQMDESAGPASVTSGDEKRTTGLYASDPWQRALDRFNLAKAEGAVMWSKGSRLFYLTSDRADEILASVKQVQVQVAA